MPGARTPVVTDARAQPDPTATTGVTIDPGDKENLGRSIPLPNTGHAPKDPGDRGGWKQTLVLVLIVGGLGTVVLLAVRDARRKRASGEPTTAA